MFPSDSRATRIQLGRFDTPQMRAFHMTWLAFLLCFFAWFGMAPLMQVVRQELSLTREQVGWCMMASVMLTIVARLIVGRLCDWIGPRRTYTWLLVLGSLPVMGISLAQNFETFLVFRLLIGLLGASFVVTQYHTSVMFAPNCVGTANATTAGWGNLGGGLAQLIMPLLFSFLAGALALSHFWAWRLSMLVAGLACLLMGIAYYRLTQDCPEGNFSQLRAAGRMPPTKGAKGSFAAACRDPRVWALFVAYAACFGIELTINNVLALYFIDYFDDFRRMGSVQAMGTAGLIASLFGLMNLFARTLGGIYADRFGMKWGLRGRVSWLFFTLFCEGLVLMLFSQTTTLLLAIPALVLFSLFVQMSEGATFSIVPFVNKQALGSVAGIVGAGGNVGAVAAGLLFNGWLAWPSALLILGFAVAAGSFVVLLVRFSSEAESEARSQQAAALHGQAGGRLPEPALNLL